MTAAAAVKHQNIIIERTDKSAPILYAAGRNEVGIRAGTTIRTNGAAHTYEVDTPVEIEGPALVPGADYGIGLLNGEIIFACLDDIRDPTAAGFFAGFHFGPSGHALGTAGGDGVPTINPYSIWDIGFRPSCADPRGMARVELVGGASFWADIYLLGVDHIQGTSRFGASVADGRSLPEKISGNGKYARVDYPTAVEIYTHHGKRLLGPEEFFAAAYGVKERCSRDEEPETTGAMDDNAERFVSRFGLCDVTGTMWQWGTDGHPDEPRASIFGGSWINGSRAGSRFASLGCWAGGSRENISARGASDHLHPA